LPALGFSAAGHVANTAAAAWQSSIALSNGVGVVKGSAVAVSQSTAMGGLAASTKAYLTASVAPAACDMSHKTYNRAKAFYRRFIPASSSSSDSIVRFDLKVLPDGRIGYIHSCAVAIQRHLSFP